MAPERNDHWHHWRKVGDKDFFCLKTQGVNDKRNLPGIVPPTDELGGTPCGLWEAHRLSTFLRQSVIFPPPPPPPARPSSPSHSGFPFPTSKNPH